MALIISFIIAHNYEGGFYDQQHNSFRGYLFASTYTTYEEAEKVIRNKELRHTHIVKIFR